MNDELTYWPETPSGILILGKRQGTKKENKQLKGRVAMAAALWYSAPWPKPYIMFTAADVHGPDEKPDAVVVKTMLRHEFNIPGDYLVMRQTTCCTLLEARAARILSRAYHIQTLFTVTHLYHAPRAQQYLNEVMTGAAIIPVHPEIVKELTVPEPYQHVFPVLEEIIKESLPNGFDLWREYAIEWLLTQAHRVDHRGRFERRLARILRPRAYSRRLRDEIG